MTVLVGASLDGRHGAAVELGVVLARSSGRPLRLCSVLSGSTAPLKGVDSDYLDMVESNAARYLTQLADALPPGVEVEVEVRRARSIARGLLAAAEECDAGYLVLGSSVTGAWGRIVVGSISDRLLHGATTPVAVAPLGYAIDHAERVARITVCYRDANDDEVLVAAALRAADVGAPLRLASFVVHPIELVGHAIYARPEAAIVDRWAAARRVAAEEGLRRARQVLGGAPIEITVGSGRSWDEAVTAVKWGAGDVLVVGSARSGVRAQVNIGAQASKIMRHAPVPVICVPRRVAAAAASDAEARPR